MSPGGFEKCYAKPLGGCTSKSKEHFVSNGILQSIGPMVVCGLPWQKPGEKLEMGHNSLTAAVLCDHHNSALSSLDASAIQLFNHLKLIDSKKRFIDLARTPNGIRFDGHTIEKWFLKVLCGVIASGNYQINGQGYGKLAVSDYLLDLLFSKRPWDVGIGLYVNAKDKSEVRAFKGVGFHLICATKGTDCSVVGISIELWGFPLKCFFATHKQGWDLSQYRPEGLKFKNGPTIRELHFDWPQGSVTSGAPTLTRTGTQAQ